MGRRQQIEAAAGRAGMAARWRRRGRAPVDSEPGRGVGEVGDGGVLHPVRGIDRTRPVGGGFSWRLELCSNGRRRMRATRGAWCGRELARVGQARQNGQARREREAGAAALSGAPMAFGGTAARCRDEWRAAAK